MHENQIHVDILSGEQKALPYDSPLLVRKKPIRKERESVLYIFSAIEQSPMLCGKTDSPEKWKEREKEGEGDEERKARERVELGGSVQGLIVLVLVCVCVCVFAVCV